MVRDIDVIEFADYLQEKKKHYMISDKYNECYGQVNNVYWSNQKDHMISWLQSQNTTGEGKFVRKVPNKSSKRTYNCLCCSEAILWIAEAVGINSDLVQKAADKAAEMESVRKRPGLIRTFISWDMIVACVDL